MPLGEFQLIERYFAALGARDDVVLGVGDDAALVRVPAGQELVVAADTLVAGVHFPVDTPPELIGLRALAVNLSDMAAMGATPAWFTLALTLPSSDAGWLEAFSRGLGRMALEHQVALIGGDTTSGPLTISVQILGFAPAGQALRRSGAQPGDLVCISGHPGDAAAGLNLLQHPSRASQCAPKDQEYLETRFHEPTPRVALGLALRGLATAAIDVSDGLLADLGKLAAASGVGARLDLEHLPLSGALLRCFEYQAARRYALAGGDDYELCFTLPRDAAPELIRRTGPQKGWQQIGVIVAGQGVQTFEAGQPVRVDAPGYDHFSK